MRILLITIINLLLFSGLKAAILDFTATKVCEGNQTIFNATYTGSAVIVSYKWDMDGDGIFDDASGSNVKYKFNVAGVYKVGLQVTTDANDQDYQYHYVVVNAIPKVNFTINNPCELTGTLFTDNSIVNNGKIKRYYWDFNNDGNVDDSSGTSVIYKYIIPKLYYIKLTVVSDSGCSSSAIKSVKINSSPVSDFSFTGSRCLGDTSYFYNNTHISGDTIISSVLYFGDGIGTNFNKINNVYHIYKNIGNYSAKLISISNTGCSDTSKTIVLDIKSSPSLTISGEPGFFYEGKTLTLTSVGKYDSLIWSTHENTNNITVDKGDLYTAIAYYNNGCRKTESIRIISLKRPGLKIMNVMTPNGDGVNDLWHIDFIEAYKFCDVKIFNKVGQQVFSDSNYSNNWDGKSDGILLPDGAYYYIVKDSDNNVYKGAINILK
ncbi:MAG: PKD domain-containing protein [Bacteroidota bacterium]|nr:PKD domain-containing protein [Bacteroidota bacterium]